MKISKIVETTNQKCLFQLDDDEPNLYIGNCLLFNHFHRFKTGSRIPGGNSAMVTFFGMVLL